ncbi:uncharacterized protein LOC116959203 isoform X2 [Tyto alba]|uniref:uncharacterized protein LOC116959203 isoform X2 n=1 Tax=Tyto alba TaxID=56313 RepID=UPI001C66D835|nr:uncharacterized protein LOC116959203 isoform X2 [Tyto alba]
MVLSCAAGSPQPGSAPSRRRRRKMRPELFLLMAGAVAAPSLSLPPLGLLSQLDGGSPKITCIAPRSYTGGTFELFAAGASVPALSVVAEPSQHLVEFSLDETVPASQCYRCRYRNFNGSAWQLSEFSVAIVVNDSGDAGCHPASAAPTARPLPTFATLQQDPSWLLPVAIGTAGLVLVLVVVAVAWRVKAKRQQAKRQQASCWTETRYPTTELSYENYAYTIGLNRQPGSPSTSPVSPPAAPHFSTFRSSA